MFSKTLLKNADDVSSLITSLIDNKNMAEVRDGLVRAVIFLRSEIQNRGASHNIVLTQAVYFGIMNLDT